MNEADRNKVPRSLREIREGAIELIAGAEAELQRVAGRVLDSIGLKGEGDVPARIRDSVNDLVDKARLHREEIERRVDEGVKQAAARVGRPIAEELGTLRARLEKVQERVEQLTRRDPPAS